MHFLIFFREVGVHLMVLDVVTGGDDLLAVRAEDIEHGLFVVTLSRGEERVAGLFSGCKCFLARLLSPRHGGDRAQQQHSYCREFRKIAVLELSLIHIFRAWPRRW